MGQFYEPQYPRGYMMRIMGLDGLIVLIGAAVFASPFLMAYFPDAYPSSVPGSFETTVHVTLGIAIATLGFFRAALAYGSAWVELVLIVLGALTFSIPQFMHMQWNAHYTTGHMLAGGGVIVLSLISGVMTIAAKKPSPA